MPSRLTPPSPPNIADPAHQRGRPTADAHEQLGQQVHQLEPQRHQGGRRYPEVAARAPSCARRCCGRRREVLAAHPRTLVVEDDHAAELAEVPLVTLAGCTDHWALVRSSSKPYGPDLRLALLAGDDTTAGRVEGRAQLASGWVSTVLQQLVLALWRDPEVDAAVTRAGREYTARRRALVRALADRGVLATGRTGINVWATVTDETATVAALLATGYVVAPGSRFRVRSGSGSASR